MKNKITNLLKIGILFFGVSLLLWNCEKDEYIEVSLKESLIKKVSLNELLKRNEFKESYTKLLEKTQRETKVKQTLKGLYQKNEEEDLYNFKIDTSSIILTELDTVVSFAMSISRNKVNNEYFENLVLQRKNNENVEAYLFRYFYSGNSIQKKGIKTIKLDPDKINFSNKMLYEEVCNDVFLNLCTGGFDRNCNGSPHIPSEQCLKEYFHCIGPTYVGRTCSSGSGDVGDISTDNNHSTSTNSGTGGGGTGIAIPVVFNTSPVKFYEIISSFEDAISFSPSRFENVETQFSYLGAVGKFLKLNNYAELGQNFLDIAIAPTTVNNEQAAEMVAKTVQILNIIKNVNSFEQLSAENQKVVIQNALFINLFPSVTSIIGQYWPKNAEEWAIIGELFVQFLPDLALGFIPGSSIVDVIKGAKENDAIAVTMGIAFIITDFAGGTILKGLKTAGKIAEKVFSSFKIVYKFVTVIVKALKSGLKISLEGTTIILKKNSIEIARIANNIMTFNYSGYGGKIITNPNKTTTLIGKFDDLINPPGIKTIKDSNLFKYGENIGGINILDAPAGTWTTQLNMDWLNDAIQRGDIIRVVSNPLDDRNLFKLDSFGNITNQISPFGMEVNRLHLAGYTFNPKTSEFIH